MEWLSEYVQIEEQAVKLGEIIFSFWSEKGLLCKTCSEAKVPSFFSSKNVYWMEVGLPQVSHSAEKSFESCWNCTKTQDGAGDWCIISGDRKRPRAKKQTVTQNKIWPWASFLIDSILLAIKMNVSLLSVRQIHNHMAKFVSIPENWQSKNYAFKFVNSINEIDWLIRIKTICSI